jgi:hypothetical protein
MIAFTPCASILLAQNRTEVTINDTGVMPENLTSSQDGPVYFGSTAKGTIYRAAPGAAQTEVRVLQDGLTSATGVTVVGNSVLALVNRAKAVVVPYR